jgi:hypothetical protein
MRFRISHLLVAMTMLATFGALAHRAGYDNFPAVLALGLYAFLAWTLYLTRTPR